MKTFNIVLLSIFISAYWLKAQQPISQQGEDQLYQEPFVEEFEELVPMFFTLYQKNEEQVGEGNHRYSSGFNSQLERETKVVLLRIDPNDSTIFGHGSEIRSKNLTHFGTYAIRVKIPDVTQIQPNVGAVASCYTYHKDNVYGISKISIEWLIANPSIIYLGIYTGIDDNLKSVERVVNLANGIVYRANQPETIRPIDNYNASSQFYTYGFDWYPDRIQWWMYHSITDSKIVLWDYSTGSTPGFQVPISPASYQFNFRHVNDKPVETNRNSIEQPLHPFDVEIDWMSFNPLEETNKTNQESI